LSGRAAHYQERGRKKKWSKAIPIPACDESNEVQWTQNLREGWGHEEVVVEPWQPLEDKLGVGWQKRLQDAELARETQKKMDDGD
jgi:hypothetical protein